METIRNRTASERRNDTLAEKLGATQTQVNGVHEQTTEVVPVKQHREITSAWDVYADLDHIQRVAKIFAASGYFKDTRDIAQSCVKIFAGAELGITPIASMANVYVVNGRPTLMATLMATCAKRAGYNYRIRRLDDNGCDIEFYDRNGQTMGISSFTREDQQRAGLNSDTWRKYPRNMFFGRAMSNGCRWFCADAFGGVAVYTPEELGASVDADGQLVGYPSEQVTKTSDVATEKLLRKLNNETEATNNE